MKFTIGWLKDHLETEATLDEIVATLTRIGLEVESTFDPAAALAPFTVAEVLAAEPHPQADRLKVCKVATASGTVQVVCGAPNARAGLKGIFAAPGTYIPGIETTLKTARIRGVESQGMLLSERELQLSDEHTGIIELDPSAAVGDPAAAALGLQDAVVDVAVTPNRPDCLGVRGIARDLAAAGLGTLKEERLEPVEGRFANPVPIALSFDAAARDACPAFAGRTIRGVSNGPSPAWLRRRLEAVGLRPINALVDVTNYIAYDRGRPLHVYDADKLKGTIRARLGRTGESFVALDGKTYAVDAEMCVIADDSGVLGLGGIIGGESTGCTEATTNVFIESAYFDPVRTARTGRKLAIQSDARYRFERGVDPAFVVPGLELATRMILDIAGGSPSAVTLAGAVPEPDRIVDFDVGRVERLTGLKLPEPQIKQILKALGFWLSGHGPTYKVAVPSWRPDVGGPADLVEEVTRIVGVDAVPVAAMPRQAGVARPVLTASQKRVRSARRALAGRGMVEAVTWSFIPRAHAEAFGGGQEELELANPISVDMSSLRPSLLPGLLVAAQRNRDRGFTDPALFEVGQAYRGDAPNEQWMAAAGLRADAARLEGGGRHWSQATKPADLFDAKADALAVLTALGLDIQSVQAVREAPAWFHPGRAGALKLGPKTVLGYFGELHPETLARLDVAAPVAAFEIDLDALPEPRRRGRTKPALMAAELQPVRRDFAFLLEEDVPAADVVRAAQGADKALIASVNVFDVFTGRGVPEGKKSLAIEVVLQPREKTLTDAEIEAVSAKIVAAVHKATGGELRG